MHEATEKLLTILQYQLLPWWERGGMERLVVSAATRDEFEAQKLPAEIRITEKPRKSQPVVMRGERVFGNVRTLVEAYPADAQDVCRHPILYCVIKGQADLHIADYVVHCPAGHFVLMRPGVPQPDGSRPHLETGNPHEYCEILHLSLLPGSTCISSWICVSQPSQHSGYGSCFVHQRDMVQQLHFFMNELLHQPRHYHQTATNSLHNYFLMVERELVEGRLVPQPHAGHGQQTVQINQPMEFAQEYLKSHLRQSITSTKMAEMLFMSRNRFLRLFTEATGCSYNAYLTRLRLERARELLATNMSVQAVSSNVGITPAQLYRIFKAHLGCSPSEFQYKCKTEAK